MVGHEKGREVKPVPTKGMFDVTPSARRLTASLRDIGYDFVSALADLVDNSVSAGASTVDVEIRHNEGEPYVLIADDGGGMPNTTLTEALRFGSRRTYGDGELGRYGLGLKTASLSQCRRVTVVTRVTPIQRRIFTRTLDLDHILSTDRWELVDPPTDTSAYRALEWLNTRPGTVVVWEQLDRVLPEESAGNGWGRRRLETLSGKAAAHLGMVFHRFIEGDSQLGHSLAITVNGEKVRPWNPFAIGEEHLVELPDRSYELTRGEESGVVRLSRFVLPAKPLFSSLAEFERMSGPAKWNRQQGLYIYRADRLVQSGGWCGMRAIDEHTKLARCALDFGPELDEAFQINVAKMRVSLPTEIRGLMEPHVTEVCHRAEAMYRRDLRTGSQGTSDPSSGARRLQTADLSSVGAALLSAALATGTVKALEKIMDHVSGERPELPPQLGW
ncbi:MAG: ATP-binding protein [Acidimicrobiales bacterium]